MEDLNINVAKGFGIKYKYISKEKSVYVCHTNSGQKIIKKLTVSPKHILFQHSVKKHLYENGFNNLDMYNLSLQNTPYFEFNGEIYVMIDRIQTRNTEFENKEDFKKIIISMGKLHKLSTGLEVTNALEFNKTDRMEESFEFKINDMIKIKKKLRKQKSLTDFDVNFIKNYDYYMDLMVYASGLLKNSQYSNLVVQAKQKNTICHNLFKEENVVVSDDELFVTNFIECSIDPWISDLADVIRRYIKTISVDSLTLEEILEIYTAINPLTNAELESLYPLIIFPSKFLKICTQYYSKKRTWIPSSIDLRMQNLISKKKLAENFLSPYISV